MYTPNAALELTLGSQTHVQLDVSRSWPQRSVLLCNACARRRRQIARRCGHCSNAVACLQVDRPTAVRNAGPRLQYAYPSPGGASLLAREWHEWRADTLLQTDCDTHHARASRSGCTRGNCGAPCISSICISDLGQAPRSLKHGARSLEVHRKLDVTRSAHVHVIATRCFRQRCGGCDAWCRHSKKRRYRRCNVNDMYRFR